MIIIIILTLICEVIPKFELWATILVAFVTVVVIVDVKPVFCCCFIWLYNIIIIKKLVNKQINIQKNYKNKIK